MATTYVVLRETDSYYGEHERLLSYPVATVEAANAAQARVLASKELPDDVLDEGVTLIAVPERNWRSGRGALKAETERRIRSA